MASGDGCTEDALNPSKHVNLEASKVSKVQGELDGNASMAVSQHTSASTENIESGFWSLPLELHLQVLDCLDRNSHKVFCRVNWRAWHLAIGYIWRDVKLIDCRAQYYLPDGYGRWMNHANIDPALQLDHDPLEGIDEHDDTPIVKKLLVLASNKTIASKVVTLTHKCHLPPPSIFSELPKISFNGQTLSSDWRTLELARLAVLNMENVQTLRVVNGHYNLTTVLLAEFFQPTRKPSVKRLWLESCSYAGIPSPSCGGLESVRLRRLHMLDSVPEYTLSRCGYTRPLPNGIGGFFETTVNLYPADESFRLPCSVSKQRFQEVLGRSHRFLDDKIYEQVPEADEYLKQRPSHQDLSWEVKNEDMLSKPIYLLNASINSLKSLTLDWISFTDSPQSDNLAQAAFFMSLSRLTFPNLRALQLRNAATARTKLCQGIYLLEPTYLHELDEKNAALLSGKAWPEKIDLLSFMERHSKVQSLAWPMDRFYSPKPRMTGRAEERSRAVIDKLGRTLVALRVDSCYMNLGEPQSDRDWMSEAKDARVQRRRFISRFASQMTRLKHLKIEGGIPRDEKREIIRAVHACPLEKIVMIGNSCPIGNTWGANGEDLIAIDEGHLQFSGVLEAENEDAILASTTSRLPEVPASYRFNPEYGWPSSPPLIHTIAMHHATTITELKFCGYNGSPVLHKPLPVTAGLLHHLRHFHNLRTLIMSFWLLTWFDHDWREAEIIDYWMNQRYGWSTALVPVPDPPPPETEPSTWVNVPMELHEDPDVEVIDTIGFQEIANQDGDGDEEMTDADAGTIPPVLTSLSPSEEQSSPLSSITNPWVITEEEEEEEDQYLLGDEPSEEANTTLPVPTDDEITIFNLPAPIDAADEQHMWGILDPDSDLSNPWEHALKTLYSPSALAFGVFKMLSPHLSQQARVREHGNRTKGVNIRASFMVGVESGDIFDLDLFVDEMGVVEDGPGQLRGPREEAERFWEKLEARLWF